MWDERFDTPEYAYGKQPNDFLAARYQAIPLGRVLSLAEGEGRNAVFLASQGYQVTAVDSSSVGLAKARELAAERQVTIETAVADLATYDLGENQWDGIVSIFFPLPAEMRTDMHHRIVRSLKPGGVYLVEAYTPEQLKHGTGGGPSADNKLTKQLLEADLAGLTFDHLEELEREVIEGTYHTGLAAVVQAVARKG
ncbi:SAM-dependent methyltransferase [Aeoliella mucimassa]|uniref:Tellurite methyltransferase n=1 Tax=Aeoliella mucimassa TaxID=2527972 RepID=A0A518AUL8_9BACT|nr:class I SAM-dependent methyltransferase [Aeoliella mucimassa]QDU58405.1 Tellurite methyltransferase [Aeoliella mucimassa]